MQGSGNVQHVDALLLAQQLRGFRWHMIDDVELVADQSALPACRVGNDRNLDRIEEGAIILEIVRVTLQVASNSGLPVLQRVSPGANTGPHLAIHDREDVEILGGERNRKIRIALLQSEDDAIGPVLAQIRDRLGNGLGRRLRVFAAVAGD